MAGSIHIKLEHSEAIDVRRDALILEEGLLKIVGHMRAYDSLRKREFALRIQIKRDLLELKSLVSSIEAGLPREEIKILGEKYKTQEIKKEAEQHAKIRKAQLSVKQRHMSDIERELENIRNKLSRLG